MLKKKLTSFTCGHKGRRTFHPPRKSLIFTTYSTCPKCRESRLKRQKRKIKRIAKLLKSREARLAMSHICGMTRSNIHFDDVHGPGYYNGVLK